MKVFVKYNWKFECDFEARGGQETFELSGLEPEDGMAVLCEKIEEKTTIRRGQPDGGQPDGSGYRVCVAGRMFNVWDRTFDESGILTKSGISTQTLADCGIADGTTVYLFAGTRNSRNLGSFNKRPDGTLYGIDR